jgi:LL-diaminopimelate aminotransferase
VLELSVSKRRGGLLPAAARTDSLPMPDTESPDEPTPNAALRALPPYVFSALDELKAEARAHRRAFVDLGIGSPDRATPAPIIDAMQRAVSDPTTHGYPPFRGDSRFQAAAAGFMRYRFGVAVEPEDVVAVAGAKEGLAHLIMAYCGPGDLALVPAIHYPVYSRAALLNGAAVHIVPMPADSGYLADFESVPDDVARSAKLLILNYPNNPTGAVASLEYFERAVRFCRQHQIVLVSDLAYSELTFDRYVAPSVLQVPGAADVAVEFHSCSKSFNMAGFRIGFAVGNARILDGLASYRTNMGYGAPTAVQRAAAHAFVHHNSLTAPIVAEYNARRDAVTTTLKRAGWGVTPPLGAIYYWLPIPAGYNDWAWVQACLDQARVVITPGHAFGPGGVGYFRLSLVRDVDPLCDAVQRITALAPPPGKGRARGEVRRKTPDPRRQAETRAPRTTRRSGEH